MTCSVFAIGGINLNQLLEFFSALLLAIDFSRKSYEYLSLFGNRYELHNLECGIKKIPVVFDQWESIHFCT
jgi:hypothetical protein